MKIYHYSPETLQLAGTDVADQDPMDSSNWLVPAFATSTEPPAPTEGKTLHFIVGAWVYQDIPQSEPEPVIAPLAGNALVLSQIAGIEATITPRRLREGALNTDGGWLKDVDAQIGALRSVL
jgi:hypothetical protein